MNDNGGIENRERENVDYWLRTKKAVERIKNFVTTADDTEKEMLLNFCHDVLKSPLVQFSFYNTDTGKELDANGLIEGWYSNSFEGRRNAEKTENLAVYYKEQEVAATLADRIIQRFDNKIEDISKRYGPFAPYVDPLTIPEEARKNLTKQETEVINDPKTNVFLKEKVWGIAVPNVLHIKSLQKQTASYFRVK